MFTSQSTIERRAAKEKRLGGLEERLTILENTKPASVDLTPVEVRLAALENKPAPVADFGPIESRLAMLESVPKPDFGPFESRLTVLEAAKPVDLSSIESRLVALETTLKTLSVSHSEATADMRARLDSAEANAAIVRKELDDMKAAAAKKPSGFTTASTTGNKNFAFPAKKKEDNSDKKREDSTD